MKVKPIYMKGMMNMMLECEQLVGGSDEQKIQLGSETKTVKGLITNTGSVDLVFTELLHHNQADKKAFVLTDVVETESSSEENHTEGVVPPIPPMNFYSFTSEPAGENNNFAIYGFKHSGITQYPYQFRVSSGVGCTTASNLVVSAKNQSSTSMIDVQREDPSLGTFLVTVNSEPESDDLVFTFSNDSGLADEYSFEFINPDGSGSRLSHTCTSS